jgi:tripartite-type tricarboxylate transporter receptor subunit TctC
MHSILQAFTLAVAVAAAAGTAPVDAGVYPDKPVRMVVPFPPGGAADLIGRVLAQRLSEQFGQPVIVENRAGASGNIGADAVAKAQGDGYTILMAALTSHSINHTLERKVLKYDLQRDLSPVMIVATVPYVLVVHPSVPARSLQDFIAHARANPGVTTYGSSGAGSPQRLAAEMFQLRTGVALTHVPYRGSGQVITDLVGGQVLAAFESVPTALPHVRAGKLHALAVTTSRRISMLPDVPTMEEAGAKGIQVSSTFGVLVPAATPRPIIDRLNTELQKALRLPGVREALLQQGALAESTTPQEAAQRISSEVALWAKVIAEANVKPE